MATIVARRNFVAALGATAIAWPSVVRAQQAMPVIGYLHSGARASSDPTTAAFHQGLAEAGFVEGRNLAVEYRWASGQYDRLPDMAADLVRRQVAVIAAAGGSAPALAAKAATATIPIVFVSGSDAVEFGLVASLSRPAGNITGVSWIASALEAKRLGLLHEAVPQTRDIAVLVKPAFAAAETQLKDARVAATAWGATIQAAQASDEGEFDAAFAAMAQQRVGALVVSPDPYFFGRRQQLVALAARHAIPTIYYAREFAESGGLMSYGSNLPDASRLAGVYVAAFSRGRSPATCRCCSRPSSNLSSI